MRIISKFIFIFIIFFLVSCTKKSDDITVLKETNLETQMIELYNQGMLEFNRGDVIFASKKFTFLGNFLMKFKISDILFTYIVAKTDCLKKLNLKSNDYCLCVEIPFQLKEKNYKYSTYPCVERERFADVKKVKAFSDGLKILNYFLKRYLNFINRK